MSSSDSWDYCHIYFSLDKPYDPKKLKKVDLPPGWKIHWRPRGHYRIGFSVKGPLHTTDGQRVRALLGLITKR